MPFIIDRAGPTIVRYLAQGENLLGFRLEDGMIVYAEGCICEGTDRQLIFPIDLLPSSIWVAALTEVSKVLPANHYQSLEVATEECWAQHWVIDKWLGNSLYYNETMQGWRIRRGGSALVLRLYSIDLGKLGLNGFGHIVLPSPIQDVFLTTREVLAHG